MIPLYIILIAPVVDKYITYRYLKFVQMTNPG
jgi:hypothetical protein